MDNLDANSDSADCPVCASTESENKGFFSFLRPRVEFCRVQISPDTDRCDVPGLSLSRYGDATVQVGQDGYVDICWLKPVYNLGHFILLLLASGVWGITILLLVLLFWLGAGVVFEDLFMSWGWI